MTIPTKTAELLADLNVLRERNGLKPLKAWKESRAKLLEAIHGLQDPVNDKSTEEPAVTKCPPAAAKGAYKKERDAKRSAGVGTKSAKTSPAKTPTREGTKASDIAREVGIDPKLLRQRLRRLATGGKLPFSHDGSWTLGDKSAIAFVRDVAKELKA